MKIYTLTNTDEQLVVDKGFKIAQRFRKNKETGEKSFFPVGIYDEAKAHTQYFFLNKSLHEKIKNEHLDRIDYVVFKPHNNIPNYLIAFPNRKDTSALLLFDGFSKDSITFIGKQTGKEVCPYQTIPSKDFKLVKDTYVCPYCGKKGFVIENEEQANQVLSEGKINPNIPVKSLIGTFIHEEEGTVNIFEKADIAFNKFLDAHSINLENETTVQFLYNKSNDIQYFISFTHDIEKDYSLDVTFPIAKGYTSEQYLRQLKRAHGYEKRLIESEENGPMVYKFPPSDYSSDESDSPFSDLLKIKDQFEVEEEVVINTNEPSTITIPDINIEPPDVIPVEA